MIIIGPENRWEGISALITIKIGIDIQDKFHFLLFGI